MIYLNFSNVNYLYIYLYVIVNTNTIFMTLLKTMDCNIYLGVNILFLHSKTIIIIAQIIIRWFAITSSLNKLCISNLGDLEITL